MAVLKYRDENGFWQELQVGTKVVANPMLTGTEQELTSLQVGNVKYKSGGGGSSVTVDSALSSTSENPVQNKVITSALNGKVSTTTYSADNKYGVAKIWLDTTDNYLHIRTDGQ